MLTLLEKIHQKLPQASELVLQEVWNILNLADNKSTQQLTTELFTEEDAELADEFARWEAASDEDFAWMEEVLIEEED